MAHAIGEFLGALAIVGLLGAVGLRIARRLPPALRLIVAYGGAYLLAAILYGIVSGGGDGFELGGFRIYLLPALIWAGGQALRMRGTRSGA